jgi:hypothetical protein
MLAIKKEKKKANNCGSREDFDSKKGLESSTIKRNFSCTRP